MTPEQFCFWLNGFVELRDCEAPTQYQWQVICNHLREVFQEPEQEKVRLGQAHRDFSF